MTDNKDFKRPVRERMAKTGESYATARMHFLDAPPPSSGFLERIRAEDKARVTREVEARRIRGAQEESGEWAAQTVPESHGRLGSKEPARDSAAVRPGDAKASSSSLLLHAERGRGATDTLHCTDQIERLPDAANEKRNLSSVTPPRASSSRRLGELC
jgi:hypothetical protein